MDRAAIVGGGPAGLAVARALRVVGVPFTLFERHSGVGGIWDRTNPGTPMYASAHFISSRTMSGHEGFPMPDHYPDYPSNDQIASYIRSYARACGLMEHIRLSTEVTSVQREGDAWTVRTMFGGAAQEDNFRWVICANGTNWHPNRPNIPGQASFNGTIQHAVDYADSDTLRGERVLVIGAGNSGVDIACDAAFAAKRAFISMRRGYHFIPKHIFGMPADVFAAQSKWMPTWLGQRSLGLVLRLLTGDLTRFGLQRPDHRPLESHPILNSQILHYIQHGDLTAKPDVARVEGDEVVFVDGTREAVDRIVLATGYAWTLPFLDRKLFDWHAGRPRAWLNLYNPDHPTLFLNGFIETNSGIYKLLDETGSMIAQAIDVQRQGGAKADRLRAVLREKPPRIDGGVRYVESGRHSGYANIDAYRRELACLRRRMGWREPRPFYATMPIGGIPAAA